MSVSKKQNGNELLFIIEGNIDSTTAPDLHEIICGALDGVTSLILDFEKVAYISSAGLRVILTAYKTMSEQGKMVIRKVNEDVMEVFTLTGFDSFLNFEN